MWFGLMVIILLTNGMSAFGLKVIAAWGLPHGAKFAYLTAWYAAGATCIGLMMFIRRVRVTWREILAGAAMAALSMSGQVAMAMALDSTVPGHVVFPVSIGGSVFVVALAGRLVFHERMNRISAAGVLCGFVSVVILSMS